MPELKSGWRCVKFGEVVRLSRENCKNPAAEGIDRFIGLEHLESGDLRVRRWGDVAAGTTFTNRARPGQVLFGKRRAYQRKVALADFDAVCSGDIYVFEAVNPSILLPELLPFLCQTDAFFDHAVGTSAGSLSPRTNWSSLAEYEFALPLLAEQLRLVEVLSASDSAWNSFSAAAAAAQLAEEAIAQAHIATAKVLATIGEYISDISYGCSMKSSPEKLGLPILRIPNVLRGELDLTDLQWLELDEADRIRFSVQAGDVLLVRTNGNPDYVGRCVLVPEALGEMTYASYLLRLRSRMDRIRPGYLAAIINSPTTRQGLRGSIRSSAGNYNINTSGVLNQRIPVCALREQDALIERLQSLRDGRKTLQLRAQAAKRIFRHLLEMGSAE